jgi:hypothetical protein
MDEEEKKLLTTWLGECWHEYNPDCAGSACSCGDWTHRHTMRPFRNRTFATWADLGAVWRRLEEKGQMRQFLTYADCRRNPQETAHLSRYQNCDVPEFFQWLLSQTEDGIYILCHLVMEALEEGVI